MFVRGNRLVENRPGVICGFINTARVMPFKYVQIYVHASHKYTPTACAHVSLGVEIVAGTHVRHSMRSRNAVDFCVLGKNWYETLMYRS